MNRRPRPYQFLSYRVNVLQGRFDPKKLPPIKKWREELATLTIGANQLYLDYTALKNDTANVEKIRRSVAAILESERQEREPQEQQERLLKKSQDMDL